MAKRVSNNSSDDSSKKKTTLPPSYTTSRKPNLRNINYNFKVNEFAMRGLNKYKNILKAPLCENCDEPAAIRIESNEDLINLCASILFDNECCRSAIFLVHKNGKQEAVFTIPEYDEEKDEEYIDKIGGLVVEGNDGFAELDAELNFHCYGLMIEQNKNEWMIQE